MIKRAQEAAVVLKTEGALGKMAGQTQGCEFVRLEIDPGGTVPPHEMPMAVTFYVMAGRGVVLIGSEQTEANEGDLIALEPGVERSWVNPGNAVLKLLVIKHGIL